MRTGDLAYFDSSLGLIPGKVKSITGVSGPASTEQIVTLKLHVDRGPYRYGEIIQTNGLHAVPRVAVRVKDGQYRIRPYTVEVDNG